MIEYYRRSIKLVTQKLSRLYHSGTFKVLEIKSKVFIEFIKDYLFWETNKTFSVRLRKEDFLQKRLFAKGFIRGLVDSDGYVRRGRKEIYFGSTSKNLFGNFLFGLGMIIFTGKRCTTFTQFPLAFSGGNNEKLRSPL